MKKIKTPSKTAPRKLTLRRESIATLEPAQLRDAVGGVLPPGSVFHGCPTTLPPIGQL
jgi:hypothetical protein